jgi:putative transposase
LLRPKEVCQILELVRSYSVPIRDDRVRGLITWYVKALQNAIDIIWDNIEWRYSFPELVRKGKKLVAIRGLKMRIPIIPGDRVFKKRLRDMLMKDNPYAAHWVDSVIRTAYSIMKNWRKRYLRVGLGR